MCKPKITINTPANLLRIGKLSLNAIPIFVAAAPSKIKISEKPKIKASALKITFYLFLNFHFHLLNLQVLSQK